MLFNASFSTGIFPKICKLGDILSFAKKGKDRTLPKNHRPISLLVVISRIFESLIAKRLYFFMERAKKLAPTQYAFRKCKSKIDPLITLTQQIFCAFEWSELTVVCSLDITKAFDSCYHEGLIFQLHKDGVRGNMLAWIKSFLTDRYYRVVSPAKTPYQKFERGLPQGSPLSPLLFIFMISSLKDVITTSHVEYAGDITLWASGKTIEEAFKKLQEDLDRIEQWSKKWRFDFGDKCTYTVFLEKKTPTHNATLPSHLL